MKTDLRYIPDLQEASQTEVGVVNYDMSNPCCAAMCYRCCNANNEY
jgi:hypothetical protein